VIRSPRATALLASLIGVCLFAGGLGVAVVDGGPAPVALETRTAAPAAPSTTATPESTTTVALAVDPAPAAAPGPTTTRAPRTTTTAARPPTTRPIQAAPGVAFTAPAPSTPSAPAPSPVAPEASGDSLTTVGAPPPAAPTGSTSYAFLETWGSGSPARWNPCAEIHYAVNTTGAPAGALTVVKQAAARMAAATGTTWVFDGTTSEVPTSAWGFGPSASFPTGWQPLLIGFTNPEESDLLDGDNAGAAYPVTLEFVATGELVHVSGAVAIDTETAAAVPMTFGGASVGSIVLHEMAHAFGLGHVQDPAQIMNPVVGPWTPESWGAGDSEGLRLLGKDSGCTRTAPPAPWD
jgi:hypothetical protein